MKDLTRLKIYVVMEAYATRDGGRKHKLDVLFKTYNQFYNFMFKNYNHYFFEKIELVKTSYDIQTNLILEINRTYFYNVVVDKKKKIFSAYTPRENIDFREVK